MELRKRLLKFLLIIMSSGLCFGQQYPVINGIPRDTSFNPLSAYKKEVQKFPFIKLVEPELPERVSAKYDLVYSSIGQRKLHLELFLPVDDTESFHPAVLLIHGGGWASGSKLHMIPMAQKLAEHGYVTAAVEYRLSPEAKYPAGIYDLKTAVRWLKANSDKYKIDTNRIASLGCSAGATLASILGITAGLYRFEGNGEYGEYSSKIAAVINMDGILDFTDPAESGKDTIPGKPSAGTRWFGATYTENPGVWKEASPINYVDRNTPPFLFVNSSLARYHAGRDSLVNMLSGFGKYTEIHTIPGTPHPFWLFHPWFEKAFDYTLKFLNKIFIEKTKLR